MARVNEYTGTGVAAPDTVRGKPNVQSQSIVRMIVLYYVSTLNMYMLTPLEGQDVDTGFRLGAMNNMMSPYGTGTRGGHTLMPGTRVLVLANAILGYADVGGRTAVHPIISVDNEIPQTDTWYWPAWNMAPSDYQVDTFGMDTAVMKCQIVDPTDRTRGMPSDMTPGDWILSNPLNGHLFVGGARVGMEGSPIASLHMYSDDSTVVFNRGIKYVEDTPWRRRFEGVDTTGTSLDFEHRADTMDEAFGMDKGKTIVPEKYGWVTVENMPPNWFQLNYKGASVGGDVEQRILTRDDKHIQPGTFDFKGVDGTVIHGGAGSVTITRTPDFPYLEMEEDESTYPDKTDDTDTQKTFEIANGYATQYADLMYELMKRRFIERYWKRQSAKDSGWKVFSAEEIASQMDRAFGRGSLKRLDGDEPAYKDDVITIKDPVENGSMKLSKLESYIHFSKTGALILSDGVGSEIRFEGGNIVISPAADLRIQPGRDMTATVPRTLSLFSGRRTEITSDFDEVDIHACTHAVLSAEGVVTIESRSTKHVEREGYDERDADRGGVIIRSATGAHVIGKDIRLAVQSPDDKNQDGVSEYDKGIITIDASASPVSINGRTITAHATDCTFLSTGSNGTGIAMDAGNMGVMSTNLTITTNKTVFGGSGVMNWIEPSERKVISVGVPSVDTQTIVVQGEMKVRDSVSSYSMASERGVFKNLKSFNAKTKESLYINPAGRAGYSRLFTNHNEAVDGVSSIEVDFTPEPIDSWFTANVVENPLWTADGVRRLGIYYPKASGYHQSNGFWTESRWQRMLGNDSYKWSPNQILDADDNPMLPFPGFDGWAENGFLGAVEEDGEVRKQLDGNWTINV